MSKQSEASNGIIKQLIKPENEMLRTVKEREKITWEAEHQMLELSIWDINTITTKSFFTEYYKYLKIDI